MVTCASLSINPSLSPPSFSTATQSSFSSAFSHSPSPAFLRFPSYHSSRTKPSSLYGQGVCFCYSERSRGLKESRKFELKASNMTITEVEQEKEEEGPPPYVDSETNSRPRRIALFVEPSPFAWVSTVLLIWLFSYKLFFWEVELYGLTTTSSILRYPSY